VQGWLRHAQLSTTLDVYIHEVDGGLGGAEAWEDILDGATWGHPGATDHPQTAANGSALDAAESAQAAASTDSRKPVN
jgi:hypothetical protein